MPGKEEKDPLIFLKNKRIIATTTKNGRLR
jgi:hypothetical protein